MPACLCININLISPSLVFTLNDRTTRQRSNADPDSVLTNLQPGGRQTRILSLVKEIQLKPREKLPPASEHSRRLFVDTLWKNSAGKCSTFVLHVVELCTYINPDVINDVQIREILKFPKCSCCWNSQERIRRKEVRNQIKRKVKKTLKLHLFCRLRHVRQSSVSRVGCSGSLSLLSVTLR